ECTADVCTRAVTASITAANKTYDGTDAATISGCSVEAQSAGHGVVSPDSVGCSASNGHFGSAAAADGKQVTADVALTGADKGNYQLSADTAATTANIGKRSVTASITAANKTYDGTDAATISGCSVEAQSAGHGVVSPDSVGCSASNGHFGSAAAADGKQVTADVALTGADKGNYQLSADTAATTANIGKRSVTASITAANKTYDGTDAATINGCTVEAQSAGHGVVSPDSVGCSASNGHFGSAAAADGKQVSADVALTGADKGNYQLTSDTAATTANIGKRSVTASITAANKTYDGTDAATINGCTVEAQSAGHGVVSPDSVGCSASNGHFGSAAAADGKPDTAAAALHAADKVNYQLIADT